MSLRPSLALGAFFIIATVQSMSPEAQQAVELHSTARTDVVDDQAVFDGIYVHSEPASFSSISMSAMRTNLP